MTFTKKERLRAYKWVLKMFKELSAEQLLNSYSSILLCLWLRDWASERTGNFYSVFSVPYDFPELLKRKPKSKEKHQNWWAQSSWGRKRRIEVLTDIINEMTGGKG